MVLTWKSVPRLKVYLYPKVEVLETRHIRYILVYRWLSPSKGENDTKKRTKSVNLLKEKRGSFSWDVNHYKRKILFRKETQKSRILDSKIRWYKTCKILVLYTNNNKNEQEVGERRLLPKVQWPVSLPLHWV